MNPIFGGYDWQAANDASVARQDSADAKATARGMESDLRDARMDINRLMMITEALWTLLKKDHNHTDQELRDLITEIDMRDGRLDGKSKTEGVYHCPTCNRPISIRMPKCIYCGQVLQHDPFAR